MTGIVATIECPVCKGEDKKCEMCKGVGKIEFRANVDGQQGVEALVKDIKNFIDEAPKKNQQ